MSVRVKNLCGGVSGWAKNLCPDVRPKEIPPCAARTPQWLKDVVEAAKELRLVMREDIPRPGLARQAERVRAPIHHLCGTRKRTHDKFVASPTKEGTNLEEMTWR